MATQRLISLVGLFLFSLATTTPAAETRPNFVFFIADDISWDDLGCYLRNHFPNQQNLCVEAYMGGAGQELWAAHAAGQTNAAQQNVF
jgi:hypothetical protein